MKFDAGDAPQTQKSLYSKNPIIRMFQCPWIVTAGDALLRPFKVQGESATARLTSLHHKHARLVSLNSP
jgi:hypothetical protein